MPAIILLCILNIFDYQETGGSNSALLISSIGNSSCIATACNPAILPRITKKGVGVVYSCPYNISLIQYSRITANYNNFGFGLSRLGHPGYQEYNLSISAGFNFNTNLSYGLILKGLYLDLGECGQSFTPALNFGLCYINNKFKFGSVLENFNNPQNQSGDDIPWAILAGAMYEPVSDFQIGVDLRKTGQDENLAFGAELKPLPILAIRIGTKTNPFLISGGIGIEYKNISFDYAVKFHTNLKQTSILSLGYFW